ncbi:hypothetical protein ASPBRDRAFT_43272 [Aspergillus brasiliensis CBS 101740]|uniref:Uncharacterized protein n=1 Tax=Aspergillus brasiliensis (strain CBS 101740 / IMI 381727 / IBT 21946) TaxID=767769 RepID=A0A1L9UJZ1_ASPBC|nr:hypothetical protein ASPBRDRAFT_43272 [Aspergillus brasiliensis CBS 101740]
MAQLVARTTPDRKVVRSSRAGLIPIFFAFTLFLVLYGRHISQQVALLTEGCLLALNWSF